MSPSPSYAAVNFDELIQRLDAEFAALQPSVERFHFELDGITTDVRRLKQPLAQGERFLITATLGSLPFSIEAPEKRQAIKAIVAGARGLPNVQFSIDLTGKITAGGLFDIKGVHAPDFMFYPLTLFLQEARPFMQLIGQYL